MTLVTDKNKCFCCGVCVQVCPHQCISLKNVGALGHLFPQIDHRNCIDCGLCRKSCPALHPPKLTRPLACFAAWSKDLEVYMTSASGGVASILSQYVIGRNGVIYGCSMAPNVKAHHIRIENVDDLWKLKGSKYVQSDMSGVYRQLEADIRAGRLTLFIGTPCQVAAVKSMFSVQPEHLLLVDLICHGVPSADLLKKHVKKVTGNVDCENVVFRDSNGVVLKVIKNNSVVYNQPLSWPFYKDWYLNTFMEGYTLRNSCYHCKFASLERCSDMTIGDFWGLGANNDGNMIADHDYGCSVILPITPKGIMLMEAIAENLYIYERSIKEAVDGNAQLQSPVTLSWRKWLFRKIYPLMGNYAYDIIQMSKYTKYAAYKVRRLMK